jgi:phosphatidylserine decarboxylase
VRFLLSLKITDQCIMPEQATDKIEPRAFPGLDPEATPLLGVGLGLAGLALGVRPRLAAVPLAFTALTALLYRNPERKTPTDTDTLFAAADGNVLFIDEFYEYRYLHTDAVRIAIASSPLDVPVTRSPASGVVHYMEHVPGEHRSVQQIDAFERNARTYIGLETTWGPVLVVQIAGPLSRRMVQRVQPGDRVAAGERLGTTRFGSRTDILMQRDSLKPLIHVGQHLSAGVSRLGNIVPL